MKRQYRYWLVMEIEMHLPDSPSKKDILSSGSDVGRYPLAANQGYFQGYLSCRERRVTPFSM